ncbi:MAG: class B sortase [Clostridia bacterium]|nr:class B sortase [Clostridia bacterium]
MAKKNKKKTQNEAVSETVTAETDVSTPDGDAAPAETQPQTDNTVTAAEETAPVSVDESTQTAKESTDAADEPVISSVIHTTTVLDEAVPPITVIPADSETSAVRGLTDEKKAEIRQDNAEFSMIEESHDNPYNNVFVESLEYVTADDLGAPPKKKKKDPVDVIIDLFRRAIFWAAVVAFFVSGYQIVSKLYSYRQSEEIYDFGNIFEVQDRREDLVATATRSDHMPTLTPVNGTRDESAELGNSASSSQFNEKLLIIQGQLQILRNTNKDIIGWIEVPGDTEINYPIVQGADNDYYLHYAYNGAYNPAGSIFIDYRNQINVSSNRHTVIYGHNMESGSPMFANLLHYLDESFLKNNRYINIYTDDGLCKYEVFAAYETSPKQAGVENHSWRVNFNRDNNVFLAWIESIRNRSKISSNVKIGENDRILTLSTCMNINENRCVVHAVLVEVTRQ